LLNRTQIVSARDTEAKVNSGAEQLKTNLSIKSTTQAALASEALKAVDSSSNIKNEPLADDKTNSDIYVSLEQQQQSLPHQTQDTNSITNPYHELIANDKKSTHSAELVVNASNKESSSKPHLDELPNRATMTVGAGNSILYENLDPKLKKRRRRKPIKDRMNENTTLLAAKATTTTTDPTSHAPNFSQNNNVDKNAINYLQHDSQIDPTQRNAKSNEGDEGDDNENEDEDDDDDDDDVDLCLSGDPLERVSRKVIKRRLESDLIMSMFVFIIVFAVHVSTVFTSLRPTLDIVLFSAAVSVGFLNHYVLPHMRLENPWYIFSQPLLKPAHWSTFEPRSLARLDWFEALHLILVFIEKNVLNVLVILCCLTASSDYILLKFNWLDPSGYLACVIISALAMKLLRFSFCEPSKQYKIFMVAFLFNKYDSFSLMRAFNSGNNSNNVNNNTGGLATDATSVTTNQDTILFELFIISIVMSKLSDFIDKLEFVYIYTAPWQLPWGSAFHAFAQPLSVPHSTLLFAQAIISSLIGAPLMPFMGSALFVLSYMRPIKFWEKNYKTKCADNSNTRLQSQLEATNTDSENLNAIFYEHLTSVLQRSLCGDLMLGRWGNVKSGDFFILSSDYLNCLVHIVEIGNGFVTFQLRGLEFKGTYCQQRELEAITEDNSQNNKCCCCALGHLKYMLSFNAAFHLRWVAWSVVARKYMVNAYRIVDNDFSLIVNFYSLRRTLIEFYIKVSCSSIYLTNYRSFCLTF
jgi:hypothetical protein